MGKKHHQKPAPPASDAPAPDLATQAAEALAARRFRKARDLYKELCKQDRAKYLPALIEANRGLATELTEKGQVSEAAQVLAYLKTIAPAGDLLAIEVQAAQRAKDWPRAIRTALELCKATGGLPPERDRTTVANALVLAFPEVEKPDAMPWPEEVKGELAAILGALRAVSESRFEDAQNLLRPLPRASIFAEWKILAKGWVAFHAGDQGKAAELFSLLPADSVPGRAAVAFQPFLRKMDFPIGAEREKAIRRTCQLAGKAMLGQNLARADGLWRTGRHMESYQEMRQAPDFPSEAADLDGAVSDFFGRASVHLPDRAAERYILGGLLKRAESGKFKNEDERRFLCRILGADALFENVGQEAETWWRKFIAACPPNEPRTRQMASLLLEKLGTWMAQPYVDPFFGGMFRKPSVRDAEGAIRNLRQSIEHDPENLAAHLELVKVYEQQKKTSERNRLLDAMAKRFPEEKSVLTQMGRECLERGAYHKGLDALQRAHQLDRLDPEIARELVWGYLSLGRQAYEKGDAEKGRAALERAEAHAGGHGAGAVAGLEDIRSRRAMLEMLFGDEAEGGKILAAARESSRSVPGLLMLMHSFHRECDRASKLETPVWAELKTLAAKTPAERARLLTAFLAGRKVDERLNWTAEFQFVEAQLTAVAGPAFSRDEASELYQILLKEPGFQPLAKQILQAGLRNDPSDPRFLLFAELASGTPLQFLDRQKLTALLEEAVRRSDKLTITIAEDALKYVQKEPAPFGPPDFDALEYGEDFEDEEGMDFPPPLAPKEIEEMKRAVAQMNDAEFAKFRKDCAKAIPLEIFDQLIGRVAKPPTAAAPEPPQKPTVQAPKPSKPAAGASEPPQGFQLDLF